jgi:hypothetical protein
VKELYKYFFSTEYTDTVKQGIDEAVELFGEEKVMSSIRASIGAENPYGYMKGIWKNWMDEMNGSDGQGKDKGGGAQNVPMVDWIKK